MKFELQADSIFSWNSTLRMGGRECGLKLNKLGKSGEILLGGESLAVDYQGMFSGRWCLKEGYKLLAMATKQTLITKFVIEYEDQQFELAKASWFGRGFVLRQGGREIGAINRVGIFSRGMAGQLPDDW